VQIGLGPKEDMMAITARRQAPFRWTFLVLFLFLAFTAPNISGAAAAEQLCLPREDAIAQLGAQFGERPIGRGLTQGGETMVELFVSASGTWTVMLTDTAGLSCLVASGQDWSTVPLLVGQVS
jgi:hypothetical protein